MRGLFTMAHGIVFDITQDVRQAVHAHFGNHIGGSMSGVYIRVPFTRLSMWVEWRKQSAGLGLERVDGALEVFAGRFQGAFCVEPKAA